MNKLLNSIPDQQIALGKEASSELLKTAIASSYKAVLFTGRNSARLSGAEEFVQTAAIECGVDLLIWNQVTPEPDIDTVLAMRDFLKNSNADTVIAAGGGSVLDAAKAALLLVETSQDINDLFGINMYSRSNPQQSLRRIIAIPTTSGTGSESTQYANIVDRTTGVKRLIAEKEIVPHYALLVPEFTHAMPQSVSIATACDALAHLLEGFLNTRADESSGNANYRAIAGIRLIVDNLPRIIEDPDNAAARKNLAVASCLGGSVIRFKSTGLPHLCSFSWFGRIEHGMAVIMLLPAAWEYYLGNEDVAQRTMELAPVFPGNTPEEVINSFRRFTTKLGVPPTLAAYPMLTWDLMESTAKSAGANKMKLELAPRPVPLEESNRILLGILEKAYKGE